MSFSLRFVCLVSLVAIVAAAIPGVRHKRQLRSSRTGSFGTESTLQYILQKDTQKCALFLMCSIGANNTAFGPIGDRINSWFGYYYDPFNFNIVRLPGFPLLQSTERDNHATRRARTFYFPLPKPFRQFPRLPYLFIPLNNKPLVPVPDHRGDSKVPLPVTTSPEATTSNPMTTEVVNETKEATLVNSVAVEVVNGTKEATLINNIAVEVVNETKEATIVNSVAVEHGTALQINFVEAPIFTPAVARFSALPDPSVVLNHLNSNSQQESVNNEFVGRSLNSDEEEDEEDYGELEGRSILPATNMLNSAFMKGLNGGVPSCQRTFPNCTLNLQQLISLSSQLFGDRT